MPRPPSRLYNLPALKAAALPPLLHRERRETVLSRLGKATMLLPAAPIRFKNVDSEYRYRPDSELFYTTGWVGPDCIALLRGFAQSSRFVLFVPEPGGKKEIWTGPRLPPQEVKDRLGADAVYPLDEFTERAPALLAAGDHIYYRLGASELCDKAVRDTLAKSRRERPRRGVGPFGVLDPGTILDKMRLCKDAAELARIKEAARVTVAAFGEGLAMVRSGAFEYEVEAAIESGFRRRGAIGPAFPTIVATGANGCTLHYSVNSCTIGADDLVLVDAGAEFAFYMADVSRTVPASGKFSGVQREVYEIVRRARDAGVAACQPGRSVADVHAAALRVIAEGLLALGVVRGSPSQVIENKAYEPFFPHQISHWLGLDIHDVGSYWEGESAIALRPGMVLTVEPGLYFRPQACSKVPELEGIAVRIEDDVLIGEDGAELLTESLPTGADEVASLVADGWNAGGSR